MNIRKWLMDIWEGSSIFEMLNPSILRVPLEIVVCNEDTFDNNFWIQNDSTKFLKDSCW